MSHVIVIGSFPESLTNFRGQLIKTMVASGHSVTAMAAPANLDQVQAVESLGAVFRPYLVQRNSMNPLRDIQTLFALRKAILFLKPDVVLSYTIKPVILGGLALRGLSGVSFFALISGLGYSFESGSLSRRLLRFVVSGFYRFSLGVAKGVIFQNSDNMELFISQGLAHASKCSVVDGSGVDLIRFRPTALPDGAPVFLLIARLIGDKGLREYAHAARIVKARHPNVRFRLLGPTDPSPDSVPLDEVQAWDTEKLLEYLGSAHDVRPSIADCHVYVLPSYHEGIPRTVLEAMAMARPILTTDVPGCRETVVAGKNGHLVPKADARALAEKLIWFIEHRDHWADMGQYSRQLAEERFDVRKINSEMMRIMNLVCIEA